MLQAQGDHLKLNAGFYLSNCSVNTVWGTVARWTHQGTRDFQIDAILFLQEIKGIQWLLQGIVQDFLNNTTVL